MDEDLRNDWCFGCGKQNPIGLKMEFTEERDKYVSRFTPGPEHQSYKGTIHGGIITTLLDEVMGRYHSIKGRKVVTAKIETRFRKPTPVGQELKITGWVVNDRGRMIEMAGEVTLADGTVTAEGKALLVASSS